MAIQKRRVIYLSDVEWDAAQRQAARHNLSASAYIRNLIVGGRVIPVAVEAEMERIAARTFTPVPKPKPKR